MAMANQHNQHNQHNTSQQSQQYHSYQPYWSYIQQPATVAPQNNVPTAAPLSPWAQLVGGYGYQQQPSQFGSMQWNYLGGGQQPHQSAFQPTGSHTQQSGTHFVPGQLPVPEPFAVQQSAAHPQQNILNSFVPAGENMSQSQHGPAAAAVMTEANPVASYFGASSSEMFHSNQQVATQQAAAFEPVSYQPHVPQLQMSQETDIPRPAPVHSNLDSIGGWSWSGEEGIEQDAPSVGSTASTTESSSQSQSREEPSWSQEEWNMSPVHTAPDVVNMNVAGAAQVLTEDETLTVMAAAPDLISPGPAGAEDTGIEMDEIALTSPEPSQASSRVGDEPIGVLGNVKAFGHRLTGVLTGEVQADEPQHAQSLEEADAPLSLAQVKGSSLTSEAPPQNIVDTQQQRLSYSEVHMYSYYEQEGRRQNQPDNITESSGQAEFISQNAAVVNLPSEPSGAEPQIPNGEAEPLENVNWDAMNDELRDAAFDQERSVVRHPHLSDGSGLHHHHHDHHHHGQHHHHHHHHHDTAAQDQVQSSAPESQQLEISVVEFIDVPPAANQQQYLDLLPEGDQPNLNAGPEIEDEAEENDDSLSTRVNFDEQSMMGHKVSVAETLNNWETWDDADADSTIDDDDNEDQIDGLNIKHQDLSPSADCRPEADQVSPSSFSTETPIGEEEISTVEFEEDGWGNRGWEAEDDWSVGATNAPADDGLSDSGNMGMKKPSVCSTWSMAVNYDDNEKIEMEDQLNTSSEACQQERLLSIRNSLGRELREEYSIPSSEQAEKLKPIERVESTAVWSTVSNFDEKSLQGTDKIDELSGGLMQSENLLSTESDLGIGTEMRHECDQRERLLSEESNLGKELREEYNAQAGASAIADASKKQSLTLPHTDSSKWSTMSNFDEKSIQGELDKDAGFSSGLTPGLSVLREERKNRTDPSRWSTTSSTADLDDQSLSLTKKGEVVENVPTPAEESADVKQATSNMDATKAASQEHSPTSSMANWSTVSNYDEQSQPGSISSDGASVVTSQTSAATVVRVPQTEKVTVVAKETNTLTIQTTVEEIPPERTSTPLETSFDAPGSIRMPSLAAAAHSEPQIGQKNVSSSHKQESHVTDSQRSSSGAELLAEERNFYGMFQESQKKEKDNSPKKPADKGHSVRARWRHKQKEYMNVLTRLDKERATTPAKLDWSGNATMPGNILVPTSATPTSAVSSSLQSPAEPSRTARNTKKSDQSSGRNNSTPKTPSAPETGASELTPEVSVIERPRRGIMTGAANGRAAAPERDEFAEEKRQPHRASSVYSLDDDAERRRRNRRRPSSRTSEYGAERYDGRRMVARDPYFPYPYAYPTAHYGYGRESAPLFRGYAGQFTHRPESAYFYGRHFSYGGQNEDEEERSSQDGSRSESEESGRSSQLEMEEAEKNRWDMEERRKRYFWDVERRQFFQKLPLAPHLQGLLWKNPPDDDYWEVLNPAEAAAFHYYYAVNGYWPEIDAFQEMYRMRMDKFRQENYYNEQAAWFCLVSEIRFNAQRARQKRQAEEKKRRAAYAAGRHSMFSDDRDDSAPSGSRQVVTCNSSDTDREVQAIVSGEVAAKYYKAISANYNNKTARKTRRAQESDRSFDMQSEASGPISREPLKFKRPHALIRFGAGGRLVVFHPTQQSAQFMYHQKNAGVGGSLEIRDIKSFIHNRAVAEEIQALNGFPGPLVPRQTPGREVIHFCLQQVEKFRREKAWDAVLVWRLLDVLVRQEGRICGADLAELLLEGVRDFEVPPEPNFEDNFEEEWPKETLTASQEEEALKTFRRFLLLGRKRDAVMWAAQNRLWGYAFYFARTLGERDFLEISARFLDSVKQEDSVYTVAAVHLGRTPMPSVRPVQQDFADESRETTERDWREHLAILLANYAEITAAGANRLTSEQEEFNTNVMRTVYALGQNLAEEKRFWAAHFCLLSAHLLAGWDVFQSLQVERGMAVPYHVALIGCASDSGFSLLECQCTEVYEFAYRLRHGGAFVIPSLKTQQFSHMMSLAEFGFSDRAFQYGKQILDSIKIDPRYCTVGLASGVYELTYQLVQAARAWNTNCDWVTELWEIARKLREGEVLNSAHVSNSYQTATSWGTAVGEENYNQENLQLRTEYAAGWQSGPQRRLSESFSSRQSGFVPGSSEAPSRRDSGMTSSIVDGPRSPVRRRTDSQRSTTSTVRTATGERYQPPSQLLSDHDMTPGSPKSPASTGTGESEARDTFFTPAAPNIYHQGFDPATEPPPFFSVGSPGSDNVFPSPPDHQGTPKAPQVQHGTAINWMMGERSLNQVAEEPPPPSRGQSAMDSERTATPDEGRSSAEATPTHKRSRSADQKGGLTSGKRNQSPLPQVRGFDRQFSWWAGGLRSPYRSTSDLGGPLTRSPSPPLNWRSKPLNWSIVDLNLGNDLKYDFWFQLVWGTAFDEHHRNESWIMSVASRLIPRPNEMKLPRDTDKEKSIWWNPETNQWEGPGMEVREAPPPPPVDAPSASVASNLEPQIGQITQSGVEQKMFVTESTASMLGVSSSDQGSNLDPTVNAEPEPTAPQPQPSVNRFSRQRGSRYVNVFDTNKSGSDSLAQTAAPMPMAPPVPNTFFMPVAPVENGVEDVNPFSVPEDPPNSSQPISAESQ